MAADAITPEARSKNMAAIRSRGNRTTELRLRMLLVRHGISGWHLHDPALPGKPDFTFAGQRLVVFVDGCFWHGCPQCYRVPASNVPYWVGKMEGNRRRDRKQTRQLRRAGWRVVRLWEHDLGSKGRPAGKRALRLLAELSARELCNS